jgi:predicted TIM-barrel fold metal-dependent hydrolase
MAERAYDGPIIDAHHHLWDLRLGKHPWLDPVASDDGLQELRRNFLAADYAALAATAGIEASVHVEANWDPADPLGEDAWLDSLARPAGIAACYVGYAPLAEPRAAAVLEGHAAHDRVTGVREILSWHPDPMKSRTPDNSRLNDPVWRANLARLRQYDFSFDLLLSPWQLADARRLASDFSDLSFILNHCGSPMDRDPESMRHWREELGRLAKAPNVSLKISDPVAYDPDWTIVSLTGVIRTCIDAFGPGRVMFASDYPVAGLHIGFAEWLAVFKTAIEDFSRAEQAAMLYDNAACIRGP